METMPEITFGDEVDALAESRAALLIDKKMIEEQIDKLENEIKARLGEAACAKTLRHHISWKAQKRASLDTKLLAAEAPEIYAKYAREISMRVLRIKQLKSED